MDGDGSIVAVPASAPPLDSSGDLGHFDNEEQEEEAFFDALEDLAEVAAEQLSHGRTDQALVFLKEHQLAISSLNADLQDEETGEIYAAPAVLLARSGICNLLCAALSRLDRHRDALRQGLDACIQLEWLWNSLLDAPLEEELEEAIAEGTEEKKEAETNEPDQPAPEVPAGEGEEAEANPQEATAEDDAKIATEQSEEEPAAAASESATAEVPAAAAEAATATEAERVPAAAAEEAEAAVPTAAAPVEEQPAADAEQGAAPEAAEAEAEAAPPAGAEAEAAAAVPAEAEAEADPAVAAAEGEASADADASPADAAADSAEAAAAETEAEVAAAAEAEEGEAETPAEAEEQVVPLEESEEEEDLFHDLPPDARRLLPRVAETSIQARHCVALELEFLAGKEMSLQAQGEISRLHAEGANIARLCLPPEHDARVLAESALAEWQRRMMPPEQLPEPPSASEVEGSTAAQPMREDSQAVASSRPAYPYTMLGSLARRVTASFATRVAAEEARVAEVNAEFGGDGNEGRQSLEASNDEIEAEALADRSPEGAAAADRPLQEETRLAPERPSHASTADEARLPSLPAVAPPPRQISKAAAAAGFHRCATSGILESTTTSADKVQRPGFRRSMTEGPDASAQRLLPDLARSGEIVELMKKESSQKSKKKGQRDEKLPSISGSRSRVDSQAEGGAKGKAAAEVDVFSEWRKNDMRKAGNLPRQVLGSEAGIDYFTRKLRREANVFKQVTLKDAMEEDLRNPHGKRKLDMVRYCSEGQRTAVRRQQKVAARQQERDNAPELVAQREKRRSNLRRLFSYYKVGYQGLDPDLKDYRKLMATASPAEWERKRQEEEMRKLREQAEKIAWQKMIEETQAQKAAFLGTAFGGVSQQYRRQSQAARRKSEAGIRRKSMAARKGSKERAGAAEDSEAGTRRKSMAARKGSKERAAAAGGAAR
mmetsp:Transcript_35305/g.82422  ORF Transcript_35305/g.82422 Transcript_35305/m.82422 type:complete len:948 (+) Transcript_35305:58-2901(+)